MRGEQMAVEGKEPPRGTHVARGGSPARRERRGGRRGGREGSKRNLRWIRNLPARCVRCAQPGRPPGVAFL